MLIALLADIHANREALDACLADAAREGAEEHVVLGDVVGYGPDPVYCIERVAELSDLGALVLKGNHDASAAGAHTSLNPVANAAMTWTRAQLTPAHVKFLDALPLDFNEDDRLYVHASGASPEDWIYVSGAREAFHSFRATAQRITFCGHTHVPALYNESASSMPLHHVPIDGQPMPLLAQRRWIAVLGAVGQPRDYNPAACYGLFDTMTSRLTYVRVPYDVDVTARKVLAAGLPGALATRLQTGA